MEWSKRRTEHFMKCWHTCQIFVCDKLTWKTILKPLRASTHRHPTNHLLMQVYFLLMFRGTDIHEAVSDRRSQEKACQLLFYHHSVSRMLSHMLKCGWQVNPMAEYFCCSHASLWKSFCVWTTIESLEPTRLPLVQNIEANNWEHNLSKHRLRKDSKRKSALTWYD